VDPWRSWDPVPCTGCTYGRYASGLGSEHPRRAQTICRREFLSNTREEFSDNVLWNSRYQTSVDEHWCRAKD